jgi:hypothetical protein
MYRIGMVGFGKMGLPSRRTRTPSQREHRPSPTSTSPSTAPEAMSARSAGPSRPPDLPLPPSPTKCTHSTAKHAGSERRSPCIHTPCCCAPRISAWTPRQRWATRTHSSSAEMAPSPPRTPQVWHWPACGSSQEPATSGCGPTPSQRPDRWWRTRSTLGAQPEGNCSPASGSISGGAVMITTASVTTSHRRRHHEIPFEASRHDRTDWNLKSRSTR